MKKVTSRQWVIMATALVALMAIFGGSYSSWKNLSWIVTGLAGLLAVGIGIYHVYMEYFVARVVKLRDQPKTQSIAHLLLLKMMVRSS